MAQFVNIPFNTQVGSRIENTATGPVVTNNGVILDSGEYFKGDACGRFTGDTRVDLSIATDSKFDFGDGDKLYLSCEFLPIRQNRIAIASRRLNADNRWHLIIDIENSTLEFFARQGGSTLHDLSYDFSSDVEILKGRWHNLEMAVDDDVARFWINGTFLEKSTASTNNQITGGAGVVFVGYANDSSTTTISDVFFDRYIDNVIFDDAVPSGLNADDDHLVERWTGSTTLVGSFSSDISPQPMLLDQDSFPNNLPDFEAAINQLFIAGIKPMKKISGDDLFDVGMTKPPTPTTSLNAGNVFEYVVTWIDGNANESPTSDPSITVLNRVTTINKPGSEPDQAVAWRIYVRNISGGEAFYRFLSEEPLTELTYTDSPLDTPSLIIIAPRFTVQAPPQSNYVAYHRGKMYYANSEVDSVLYPTRVYFSQTNRLEEVDVNDWFYVGQDDSEIITGIVSYRGNLVVFKENSIYLVLGTPGTPDLQIIQLSLQIGCVSHRTIVEVEGTLMWLAEDGVYAWNGGATPIRISNDIEPDVIAFSALDKSLASGAIDTEYGLYLLKVGAKIYCYNYREVARSSSEVWTEWDAEVDLVSNGIVGTNRDFKALFAGENKVGIWEKGLDLARGIAFQYTTGYFNPFSPGSTMHVNYATIMIDTEEGRRYLDAGYSMLDGPSRMFNFNETTTNNIKFSVNGRGEYIALVFEGIDIHNNLKMVGFTMEGNKASRR